jgi:putative membrane protein
VAPNEAESSRSVREARQGREYSRFIFRAPSLGRAAGYLVLLAFADAALAWLPGESWSKFLAGAIAVFALPGLLAIVATPNLAAALGGRFSLRRSGFLALASLAFPTLFLLLWRGVLLAVGNVGVAVVPILLFAQGPILWFRHMSLFGMSNTRHGRTLPVSLLQPLLAVAGLALVFGLTAVQWIESVIFLVLGFVCCLLLLRAADRPLRREFNASGVALIRPFLEHIANRDPGATQALERFFRSFAVEADLRVTAFQFRGAHGPKATVALPSVHPGPFAALGASDLPRKLGELVGDRGGLLLVPHTPCNHDLDLPTGAEVARIGETTSRLLADLPAPTLRRVSPLCEPHAGSWARAQLLGDVMLVVASRAPGPTDDMAFAVADVLYHETRKAGGPVLALIDAHNSYREDEGDLPYGSPQAHRLSEDVRQAVALAESRGVEGPLRVGVAQKGGYSVGTDGIGPHGIRALAVEASGTRTAYVLIDGNNLLEGLRAPMLEALRDVVDDAEVMTTDNHVVHEVDGGLNPVGERYPADRLRDDVVATVREALGNLEPVEVRVAVAEVPGVSVLGPDWTARLLTSLGDTLSMFSNALLTTFLLLAASSTIVLAVLR